MNSVTRPKLYNYLFTYYFATGVIEGLACLWILIQIPSDPKNLWLFGFSKLRLGLIGLVLGGTTFFLLLLIWKKQKSVILANILDKLLEIYDFSFPGLLLFFTGSVIYPYLKTVTIEPREAIPERLAPVILFFAFRLIQLGLISSAVIITRKVAGIHWRGTKDHLSTILLSTTGILVLAHISMYLIRKLTAHREIWELKKYYELTFENNFPAIFSTILLLIASYYIGIIAINKAKSRDRSSVYWIGLFVVFFFLAVDEYWGFHESFDRYIRENITSDHPFAHNWIYSGIILVLLFAVAFWRFFWRLPPKTRMGILLSALLYVGGALGFEIIGSIFIPSQEPPEVLFLMITTVEETLEMVGMIVFIHVLRAYTEEPDSPPLPPLSLESNHN
jgi:hypothetical protein